MTLGKGRKEPINLQAWGRPILKPSGQRISNLARAPWNTSPKVFGFPSLLCWQSCFPPVWPRNVENLGVLLCGPAPFSTEVWKDLLSSSLLQRQQHFQGTEANVCVQNLEGGFCISQRLAVTVFSTQVQFNLESDLKKFGYHYCGTTCCKMLLLLKFVMKLTEDQIILWQWNSVLVNEQTETTDKFRKALRHSWGWKSTLGKDVLSLPFPYVFPRHHLWTLQQRCCEDTPNSCGLMFENTVLSVWSTWFCMSQPSEDICLFGRWTHAIQTLALCV